MIPELIARFVRFNYFPGLRAVKFAENILQSDFKRFESLKPSLSSGRSLSLKPVKSYGAAESYQRQKGLRPKRLLEWTKLTPTSPLCGQIVSYGYAFRPR